MEATMAIGVRIDSNDLITDNIFAFDRRIAIGKAAGDVENFRDKLCP